MQKKSEHLIEIIKNVVIRYEVQQEKKKNDIESHERESPNSVKKPKPNVRKYPQF